jgi:hypothetical protein
MLPTPARKDGDERDEGSTAGQRKPPSVAVLRHRAGGPPLTFLGRGSFMTG